MARKVTGPAASTPVQATRHTGESRVNIPTAELEPFAAADEQAPTTMLYPRDPSLDPQLVWKGKDEQDAQPTSRCRPCRSTSRRRSTRRRSSRTCARASAGRRAEPQLDLFADFNGLDDFEKKVEFYQHDQHWSNRMILGDRLLVMASLAEKERPAGQGPDDLHRPALRHQVRHQLAGEHPQARREGRQGRGPDPPARADQGVPRHLGARHPLATWPTCATGSPSPATC